MSLANEFTQKLADLEQTMAELRALHAQMVVRLAEVTTGVEPRPTNGLLRSAPCGMDTRTCSHCGSWLSLCGGTLCRKRDHVLTHETVPAPCGRCMDDPPSDPTDT
jgi:hypothetical protein